MTKKFLLVFSLFLFSTPCFTDENNIKWINTIDDPAITINGLAWFEQNGKQFIRLPISEKENITEKAWKTSLAPSGARVRFKTNSTSLHIKVDHGVSLDDLSMFHMSFVGVSGIDLYVGPPCDQQFWATTVVKAPAPQYCYTYFESTPAEWREFTLYLPVYAPLKSLEIGIDTNAELAAPTPYKIQKPIVVYGTSITQGGCSSRGANGFVPAISRELDADVINLGFSGSGRGEPIMAELMTQIDASLYIVDSVANMPPDLMNERYDNFIKILRDKKPDTPIILMTKIHFAQERYLPESADEYQKQHEVLLATYNKRISEGDKSIFLFDTGVLIPPGHDHSTVDGVHLTDVGFKTITNHLTPFIKNLPIDK